MPILGNTEWYSKSAATAQFEAIDDPEVYMLEVRAIAAAAINELTNVIFEDSQREVPRSIRERDRTRHELALWQTGKAPINDPEYAANPEKLEAQITYGDEEHPYAAALHEGEAFMDRNGKQIHWVVEQTTTPGTKTHYLEDPLKAHMLDLEGLVAAKMREVFG